MDGKFLPPKERRRPSSALAAVASSQYKASHCLPCGILFVMRAEFEQLVSSIKQSVELLRRRL
jgi:hypothetical protein